MAVLLCSCANKQNAQLPTKKSLPPLACTRQLKN